MRRTIIILVLSLLSGGISSYAARYAIYKIEGEVLIKRENTDSWENAFRRDIVEIKDILKIAQSSAVTIINLDSGQLFNSADIGEIQVYKLISKAKAKSANLTSLMCKELVSEMKNYTSGNNDLRVGAVYRGESDMLDLDILASQCMEDKTLSLETVEEDGTVYFILRNVSNTPKYANVIRVALDGSRYVCFEFKPGSDCEGLLIPPGVTVGLPQYRFLSDKSTYKAFSSSFPIDTRALQRRL